MSRKSLFRKKLFWGLILFCFHAQAGINLPEIDAREFQSTPIQKSRTGRVYLFQTEPKDLPATGSIVLIHAQNKPAMAFRVLRTDVARSEYIGKKVRRYDKTGELEIDAKYLTVEKVADLLSAPAVPSGPSDTSPATNPEPAPPTAHEYSSTPPQPPASSDDTSTQPAQEEAPTSHEKLDVNSFDEDLDSGTTPEKQSRKRKIKDEFPEDYESDSSFHEVEETSLFNPFNHSLGLMVGSFKNFSGFNIANNNNYDGFIMMYGMNMGRDIFVLANSPQDSLDLEFGLGYYSRVNHEQANDVYNIMPIQAQFKYGLQFSKIFEAHLYGGLQFNYIISGENETDAGINKVQGIQHTIGLGMIFTLGPHWFLRGDLGWDKIAAGLMIEW